MSGRSGAAEFSELSVCLSQVSVWRKGLSIASFPASMPASTFTWVPDTCWMVRHAHRTYKGMHPSTFFPLLIRSQTQSMHSIPLPSGPPSSPLLLFSDSWYQKKWGHNVLEFRRRFDAELTAGEGPKRLRNLYFLYLIELRALAKALPFFQRSSFQLYTGKAEEDQKHKEMMVDVLQLARSESMPV